MNAEGTTIHRRILSVFVAGLLAVKAISAGELYPCVEVEEDVYSYEPASNGSGPMWCHGSTCIVRVGDRVFASGLETLATAKPLNNCVPLLFFRGNDGWVQVYRGTERTREPSPMAAFSDGRVFLSNNPTATEPDTYNGPARPQVLEFKATEPEGAPKILDPTWDGSPSFTEHSYRSFAADADRREFILLQNVGYAHAEWSFRDQKGEWSAAGQLAWPWEASYEKPGPVRVCYPAVALKDKAVYFLGVSDIVEPKSAWRLYKKELTGRDWDYDFRRLFFTWSDDVTSGEFHDWVEVASREETGGNIMPADLYVAPNGDIHVLWTERALDERLREKFFPDEKQRHSLEYAILRSGEVIRRVTLAEGGDGLADERPGLGRFHVNSDNRLWVFYYVGGRNANGQSISENRIVEIGSDGSFGEPATVELQQPLSSFFTSTVRAGCQPSNVLDVFGAVSSTMRYARIRMGAAAKSRHDRVNLTPVEPF